jgi:cytochrome c biogenesis factor
VIVVGELALWVALFLSVWGSAASFIGAKLVRPELVTSGRRAVVAAAGMVLLACLGLWAALLSHDFALRYVASHTTLNTPTLYLLTAFWAGPAGRMLFFALAVALCGAVAVTAERRLDATILTWITGALATLLALVLVVVCFGTYPYDRIDWVPAEGEGLEPQLQTTLAAPYFLATYGAYGAATVGLALGVVAAIGGRVDRELFAAVRRWSIICWSLLTVGIAVRMRWSYLEPTSSGFSRPDLAQVTSAVVWALSFALLWSLRAREDASRPRATRRPVRLVGALAFCVGLAILVAGVAASRFWTSHSVSLRPGETAELTDQFGRRWRFISQGASRDEQMNSLSTGVALDAWRNGRHAGIISAERRQYLDSVQRPTFEPSMKPGIWSSLLLDVYAVLAGLRGEVAELRVGFRPLVAAVWIGWILVVAGGLALAGGPARARVQRTDAGSAPVG